MIHPIHPVLGDWKSASHNNNLYENLPYPNGIPHLIISGNNHTVIHMFRTFSEKIPKRLENRDRFLKGLCPGDL